MPEPGPHVGLFVTCLVDLMRPTVGFAAVRLLEAAGCRVTVPAEQTCCGQPAYNSGDREDAIRIAKQVIGVFEGFDYVVLPSGSCACMIRLHYPGLFAEENDWKARADALAQKTFELTQFLVDILGVEGALETLTEISVTYHDSCSGLRELGIKDQPRKLLTGISGLTLIEGAEAETCCGFGGTFCIKYPEISGRMVDSKAEDLIATGADTVLAGDMGCLMNIAGRLKRKKSSMQTRHVAEILAGLTDRPAIGEASNE